MPELSTSWTLLKRTNTTNYNFIVITHATEVSPNVNMAYYHKSQFTSRAFTICTAYDTLCPQTLNSDKEKLPINAMI